MADSLNTIQLGDCIVGMQELCEGSIDLAFADPPFNIGYDYDVYDDSVKHDEYIDWSRDWISGVYRVLKSDGAFWLAIGDEYAAELKLASQQIGFHCRSWVIWYYTFGVNCTHKFTRSHAHLFHFVKDPQVFTFRADDLDNRIPSARQLVYNDKRANPKGRLPDDTWIIRPADVVGELLSDDDSTWSPNQLAAPVDPNQTFTLRPQDVAQSFSTTEDTWYFPRVAGTFKERSGFHGCQMPEQLLARIIRTCSNEKETVIDPFSGSATTLAVAKKLGRRYVGFELSDDYVRFGRERLDAIRVGDPLDGTAEPLMSVAKTGTTPSQHAKASRNRKTAKSQRTISFIDAAADEERYTKVQLELTLQGVIESFCETHQGFSPDRLVADPDLNRGFVESCKQLGLAGDARTWNCLLFRLRKAGKLSHIPSHQRTLLSWEECEDYLFASEIALQTMLDDATAENLDEILCDPYLAEKFDTIAQRFAPGHESMEYRWAALKLRKEAKNARCRGSVLIPPTHFGRRFEIEDLQDQEVPETSGVYIVSDKECELYVGEAMNLRHRLNHQFAESQKAVWTEISNPLSVQLLSTDTLTAGKLAWQSCLLKNCRVKPRLNYVELCGLA